MNVTQGLSASSVVVATFSDANTSDTAAQFTATIDWGDGTTADSTGTVTGGNGSFTVTGNHTYADPGHENLTVTVLDSAGPSTTVNPTAVIGSADERFIGELYRVLLGSRGRVDRLRVLGQPDERGHNSNSGHSEHRKKP